MDSIRAGGAGGAQIESAMFLFRVTLRVGGVHKSNSS